MCSEVPAHHEGLKNERKSSEFKEVISHGDLIVSREFDAASGRWGGSLSDWRSLGLLF